MSSRSRTLNTTTRDKPLFLTVTPVKYSLTEGTDIPPPPESPVKQQPPPPPAVVAPPPTGAGPLNSHPTTPERKIPGAYPESDVEDEADTVRKSTMDPTSPSSPEYTSSPPGIRRTGVRRMFSLTNLRQSFSSSRTSLALPRPSNERPSTSRYDRPFTPSVDSIAGDSTTSGRPRRSGWFKRKSSLFNLRGDDNTLDENSAYDPRGNKRLKSAYSVPLLPDISELAGGELDGGDLGWDASTFKRF